MPKISVIITTHDGRRERCREAIESVLSQTYLNFELIIVDDASKDGTDKMVSSFVDKRISYIKRKKNFGNDTRPKNEGTIASNGEYVAYLDSDNTYRPDHLLVLLREMENDPNLDVVYGDRWLIDETNRIKPQLGIARDFNSADLMQRNFIDTADVLIKRQAIFDVGGWDERYKKYVDWNLWVRMDKYGKKFKRVPQIITDYHLHEKMKSLTVKERGEKAEATVPLGSGNVFKPEWDAYDLEIELPYLNTIPRDNPRVAVFTLTYDRLKYTKASFKSLRDTADYKFDHFVVDNGSQDGTVDYLNKEFKAQRIKRIKLNTENEGISKASNDAVKMIKNMNQYDIILKWDNDCIGLTNGWLVKMVQIWKSNHRISLSCYVQGLVDNPGGAPRLGYGQLCGELIGVTKHLGGICHFVDIHAYDKFEWDENSFLHGVQDMEMSQHLIFNGYTLGYMENFFVSHGPLGTAKQKEEFKEYFDKREREKQTRYEDHK